MKNIIDEGDGQMIAESWIEYDSRNKSKKRKRKISRFLKWLKSKKK